MRLLKTLILVVLLGLGGVLCSRAHADANAEARKAIQTLYDKINAAILQKNISAATAYYAPDYKSVDRKGNVHSAADERQSLQMIFQTMKLVKCSAQVQKVSLQGKNATVTVSESILANIVNPQTHAPAKLEIAEISRDVWVKIPAGWREKSSQSLSEHAKLNGKEVPNP